MNSKYEYSKLLSDADRSAGFTTIGFCLAITDSLMLPESISMRGIRSVLDVKYSREDRIEYRPMDSSTIAELFGMDLEFLTPILLTKTRSPFVDAINQFDLPHDCRVRSDLNPICYAALWQMDKVVVDSDDSIGPQRDSNHKLFQDAHAVAERKCKNLVIFAVPGWSYETYPKNRLCKATRSRMSNEGMLVTDRICANY